MIHFNGTFSGLTSMATLAASGLLLSACASAPPPPHEQLAVGRAAVERADGPAAAEAPIELAAARDKIARANLAFANKDYVLARQLAEQAEADANLAEAQSRSVRSGKALSAVRDGVRQLRDEVGRP
jgi:hypothetical protein